MRGRKCPDLGFAPAHKKNHGDYVRSKKMAPGGILPPRAGLEPVEYLWPISRNGNGELLRSQPWSAHQRVGKAKRR